MTDSASDCEIHEMVIYAVGDKDTLRRVYDLIWESDIWPRYGLIDPPEHICKPLREHFAEA
jgi:hypothetical protein